MRVLPPLAALACGLFGPLLGQGSAAGVDLGGLTDSVARVGFPVVSAFAAWAWTVYQDRVFRGERAADRDAHLNALGEMSTEVRGMREAFIASGVSRPGARQ